MWEVNEPRPLRSSCPLTAEFLKVKGVGGWSHDCMGLVHMHMLVWSWALIWCSFSMSQTISMASSPGTAQLDAPLSSSYGCSLDVWLGCASFWNSEFFSKLVVVGKIWFLVPVAPRLPFSCWLSAKDHFQQLRLLSDPCYVAVSIGSSQHGCWLLQSR